jgi:hypothetical protein
MVVRIFEKEDGRKTEPLVRVKLEPEDDGNGVNVVTVDEDGDDSDVLLTVKNDGTLFLWPCVTMDGIKTDTRGKIKQTRVTP